MPPQDPVPQPPQPKSPEPKPEGASGAPDPKSFLLPKKESGPNVESATRMNAGALLAAEQSAELPKPAAPEEPPVPLAPQKPEQGLPGQGLSGQGLRPLQTFRADIESVVQEQNVSVVDIAAAEAERRGRTATPAAEAKRLGVNAMMILAGGVLIAAAFGAFALVWMLQPKALPAPEEPRAPFITVDGWRTVGILPSEQRATLMPKLLAARESATLPLGLIEWVYITKAATADTPAQPTTAQEALPIIAPTIPPELLRTLEPHYLLGLHSFDEHQAFLILQIDSYGTAYAAMLEWEHTLAADLAPLFTRTPSPKLVAPAATSTASSTLVATSTSSTTPIELPPNQFIPTDFIDTIVENRDVRALKNEQGDLLLLWTMLGRNIIVITTNEYTLREITSRMQVAPSIPTPGN